MKRLSKSRYTTFCQCPKALWLKVYKPDAALDDSSLASRFEEGREVGNLAKKLFDDAIDVSSYREDGSIDIASMIDKTSKAIENGTETICEASFANESNYCAVDILHKEKSGWAIYEVKSSTYKCEEDDTEKNLLPYLQDIAYQKWVLEQCGLRVSNTYLVRLDSNYVREDSLDIQNLFHISNVNRLIKNVYDIVSNNVKLALKTLAESTEPESYISAQCNTPYLCSFLNYCKGEIPSPNVFDLYRMKFADKCKLFNQQKITFDDLKDEPLTEVQQLQVTSHLSDSCYIEPESIRRFLDGLSFPLYFLDFETMQLIVPAYSGTKPYQQIPFQYSLHRIDRPGGEVKHSAYLGNSINDPRRELAEKLCRDIPMNVCVTAYNKSFECARISELAEAFPDLANHLLNIRDNIVDLIDPFRQKMVYYPKMNGSFSIKKVLPALFPKEPELDYSYLSGAVHNGSEAMSIYPRIAAMSTEEAKEARKALLEYCCLDTLAMVRIWEKLIELSEYKH